MRLLALALSMAGEAGAAAEVAAERSSILRATAEEGVPALLALAQAALREGKAHYQAQLWVRVGVWVAGAACLVAFLQEPVTNTVALISALLSLSLYLAVLLVLGVAALHQFVLAEDQAALRQMRGPQSPTVMPSPRRLEDRHRRPPAEVFRKCWELPRPVVEVLGECAEIAASSGHPGIPCPRARCLSPCRGVRSSRLCRVMVSPHGEL